MRASGGALHYDQHHAYSGERLGLDAPVTLAGGVYCPFPFPFAFAYPFSVYARAGGGIDSARAFGGRGAGVGTGSGRECAAEAEGDTGWEGWESECECWKRVVGDA